MFVFVSPSCQFIVQEDADYSLHTVQPDLLVDWKLIEQIVRLFVAFENMRI